MEEWYFPDVLYESHLKEIGGVRFTSREVEIIALIMSGRSRKKTASFLDISPKTVENHTRNIMEKLGCHSQDGIVDFMEMSGKLCWIKQFHSSWLIHTEFLGILKHLALSRENPPCSLVRWPSRKKEHPYLAFLKNHLKLANVRVTVETRHKIQSLPFLLSEATQGIYKVYLLPSASLDLPLSDLAQTASVNPLLSRLFILPPRDPPGHLPGLLTGCDVLDRAKQRNCYILTLEILKRLFIKYPFEGIVPGFQDKMGSLTASYPEEKRIWVTDKNSPTKGVVSGRKSMPSPNNKLSLNNRKFLIVLAFLCLAGSIGLYHALPLSSFWHGSKGKPNSLRSEFIVPTDGMLLDRSAFLTKIHNHFKQHPGRICTIALTGIGGSGKTTLARQYARRQRAPVVWEINAETRQTVLVSFENLAQGLAHTPEERIEIKGIQEIKDPADKEDRLISWVQKRLLRSQNWFLLYDNMVSVKGIQKFLPSDHHSWGVGQVLITTRNSQMSNHKIESALPLEELSPGEKLTLFTKILTAGSGPLTTPQTEKAREFLKAIPPFPLDIALAAHYLKRTAVPYPTYLTHLKENRVDFEALQKEVLEQAGDYHKTRYSIVALYLKDLLAFHKDFQDLLFVICFVNARDIPRELLTALKGDVVVDHFIHHLKTYSFITEARPFQNQPLLSIHPSLQENGLIYLKHIGMLDKAQPLLKHLADALGTCSREAIQKQDLYAILSLITHCQTFLTHADWLTDGNQGIVKGDLGHIYLHVSAYKAAQEMLEEALTLSHKYGQQVEYQAHRARFSLYLADVYRETGNYDKAKTLLEESLALYRTYFPEDRESLATALAHLGAVYRHLGNFGKSKNLLEESIALYQEQSHKPSWKHHPDFAWALVHLGNTYREMGNLSQAADLLERSLVIYRKYFPSNSPTTAWTMAQSGNIYREMGQYEKAMLLLEESLAIYEAHLPHSHDRIAWNLTHLGDIYNAN